MTWITDPPEAARPTGPLPPVRPGRVFVPPCPTPADRRVNAEASHALTLQLVATPIDEPEARTILRVALGIDTITEAAAHLDVEPDALHRWADQVFGAARSQVIAAIRP